jgi:hypothetical protein
LASTDVTLDFNAYLAQGAAGLDAVFLANTGIDLDIRTMDFFGLTARCLTMRSTMGALDTASPM